MVAGVSRLRQPVFGEEPRTQGDGHTVVTGKAVIDDVVAFIRLGIKSANNSVSLQHPFIKAAKPNSILKALITDAMEIKMKKLEAEQREQDADDDDNSVNKTKSWKRSRRHDAHLWR